MTSSHESPHYWDDAIAHLSNDPVMHGLITRFPEGQMTSRGDPFYTLMRSIIGQQISVQSADAVWGRLAAAVGEVHPDTILALSEETARTCGLSRQKITYMRHLADFFRAENITSSHTWHGMDDEAVIAHITQVKGIGRWTAEMFMMFCLLRSDVFPLDDIGLHRALYLHYMPKPNTTTKTPFAKQEALNIAANWQPYRSVATWYLWRAIDPSDVGY
jgi:DNA-3-methyladenine glycosylase II